MRCLAVTRANIAEAASAAAALLRAGELIALPTETVYGLAGDAANGEAVARIFAAKGRPRFNPLICHVSDIAMAERYGHFDDRARGLAERFWPGPLTLVVPLQESAPAHPLATAGLPTIALRAPRGPARDVVAAFGGALAAPSANRSGRLSPTHADHVIEQLGESVSLVLDAGPCEVGVESSIVSLADKATRLLRAGGVATEEIEAALGEKLERAIEGDPVTAPGMLASHYAPRTPLRLNAMSISPGEALLAFGPADIGGADNAVATRNLSLSGDPVEAATNLFAHLAELDSSGASSIAVAPIPHHSLGEAINDRLIRAAAR